MRQKTAREAMPVLPSHTLKTMSRIYRRMEQVKFFHPLSGADAYQTAMLATIKASQNLPALRTASATTYLTGVFKNALLDFQRKKVLRLRSEYRKVEKINFTPAIRPSCDEPDDEPESWDIQPDSSVALPSAEERRLAAGREIAEILAALNDRTITRAFIAYIRADGNLVRAACIAGMSKTRFYRSWETWLLRARKVAEGGVA